MDDLGYYFFERYCWLGGGISQKRKIQNSKAGSGQSGVDKNSKEGISFFHHIQSIKIYLCVIQAKNQANFKLLTFEFFSFNLKKCQTKK